jgi:hypothetical protein
MNFVHQSRTDHGVSSLEGLVMDSITFDDQWPNGHRSHARYHANSQNQNRVEVSINPRPIKTMVQNLDWKNGFSGSPKPNVFQVCDSKFHVGKRIFDSLSNGGRLASSPTCVTRCLRHVPRVLHDACVTSHVCYTMQDASDQQRWNRN